jgi:hypothetical protein
MCLRRLVMPKPIKAVFVHSEDMQGSADMAIPCTGDTPALAEFAFPGNHI